MQTDIVFNNELEKDSLSAAHVMALDKLMAEDQNVVSLDADLMHAIKTPEIKDRYPGRVESIGIAEANMVGMAAGLSYSGKTPYVHTFVAFIARRAFDQLFVSCGYAHNKINIFGSDPGIFAAYNGGTHMSFEDLAIMRTIPDATVIDIADNAMMYDIVMQAKDIPGVVYFRAGRGIVKKIYADGSRFEVGKGIELRNGTDVTIITSGIMVPDALNAAAHLENQGVSAAVIDMFTIKPIDVDLIVRYAEKTGAIVTTDNHNINGGLGDAVAAVLAEHCPTPMKKLAVPDQYGQVGSLDYLRDAYSLNETGIIEQAKKVLRMKK
jgi:transketolase